MKETKWVSIIAITYTCYAILSIARVASITCACVASLRVGALGIFAAAVSTG